MFAQNECSRAFEGSRPHSGLGSAPASCCLQPDVLLLFIASLIILSVVTAVLCGILHDYPCCLNLILQGRREESALDLPAAD